MDLLRHFHSVLFRTRVTAGYNSTHSVGGWGGWTYAVGSSMAMKNAVGDQLRHTAFLIPTITQRLRSREIRRRQAPRGESPHLGRKEIENFVLQPRAIRRVLSARIKEREAPTEAEIWNKIIEICELERQTVEDGIASAMVQATEAST